MEPSPPPVDMDVNIDDATPDDADNALDQMSTFWTIVFCLWVGFGIVGAVVAVLAVMV